MSRSRLHRPRWLSRRGLLQGAAAAAATVALRRGRAATSDAEPSVLAQEQTSREALARASDFLWSQQADDGGWHSPQYAVLRSGQALTPFVLHALLSASLNTGQVAQRAADATRALDFIRSQVADDGSLGRSDPELLEYPVYSTAYAVQCLLAVHEDQGLAAANDDALIDRLHGFVASAQCDGTHGFTPESPAFGGWGFDKPRAPGDPGHMDLAHTRRALDALRAARPRYEQTAFDCHFQFKQAQHFLRVVQNLPQAAARPQVAAPSESTLAPSPSSLTTSSEPAAAAPGGDAAALDGGFYFSPVVLAANKGRHEDADASRWRSYATATCDGILALLAAGVPREDERMMAAIAWLGQHTNLDYPQGVPTEHPEPWGAAIRFYHYAVRAEVYRKLDWPAAERLRLATAVAANQNPDGSFVNRQSALMKEDDPVMCTALAATALSNCLAIEEIHHNGTTDTTR